MGNAESGGEGKMCLISLMVTGIAENALFIGGKKSILQSTDHSEEGS